MFDFIIVMAGSSSRMGLGYNKALYKLNNLELYLHSLEVARSIKECNNIILVTNEEDYDKVVLQTKDYANVKVCLGGDYRSASVLAGLKASNENYCLIHDAARPFVKKEDILNVYHELEKNTHCAILVNKVVDTIKEVTDNVKTLNRCNLVRVLTPQGVNRIEEIKALDKNNFEFSDDAQVFEEVFCLNPILVYTENQSPKLTTKQDLEEFSIGQGYDIHKMMKGDGLVLGGEKIPCSYKFVAHSDGDVVLHAIINALFGAIGSTDIGTHFPDTDSIYKGVDSKELAHKAIEEVRSNGYVIHNIDVSIVLQKPSLKEYKEKIKENIQNIFSCPIVSIKANTNEGIGAIGKNRACKAYVSCLLKKE